MATTPALEAFHAAKQEFLRDLPDTEKSKLSNLATIEDVYDATDQIQKEQAKSGTLRNLRKIQPYLECVHHYAGIIETFVQAKADILALIWVRPWSDATNMRKLTSSGADETHSLGLFFYASL
jgi:hypothetical protein